MPPENDGVGKSGQEPADSPQHVPPGSSEDALDTPGPLQGPSPDDGSAAARTSSAQEIFQASLTFENLQHNVALPPTELERHASAGGTLYPTLESVSAADNNLDPKTVEENWEAAARPSSFGYFNGDNLVTKPADASLSSHCDVIYSRGSPVVESNVSAVAVESGHISATPFSYDDMGDSGTEAASMAMSGCETKLEEPGVFGESSYPAAASAPFGSNLDWSPAAIRHRETTAEDEDLIALKRAAAYGGYDVGTVSVSVDVPDQHAEATIVEYDIHPSDILRDDVHAELIGHDFSGAMELTHQDASPPVASAAAAASPPSDAYEVVEDTEEDHAAEATVIESGPIADNCKATAESWSSSLTEEAHVLQEEVTIDAVVDLDSKPPASNYSQPPWRMNGFAVADEEAEVVGITDNIHPSELTEDAAQAELIGTDSNCAVAIASNSHEDIMTGTMDEGFLERAISGSEHAEVVGFTHSDVTGDAAQAEFIGVDSNQTIAVHPANSSDANINENYIGQAANGTAEVVDISEDYQFHPSEHPDDAGAQAELIGTGPDYAVAATSDSQHPFAERNLGCSGQPIAGAEAAESVGVREGEQDDAHAKLVGIESSCASVVPSRVHQDSRDASNRGDYSGQALGDGAAEVVSITEELHPSEHAEDVSAQAELIGTDASYAVSTTTSARQTPDLSEQYADQDVAGEQAHVVGVTEDFEEVDGSPAEVEFVVTDAGCALAVASDIRRETEGGNMGGGYFEQATVLAGQGSQAVVNSSMDGHVSHVDHNEVQATLVVEQGQQLSSSTQNATAVTALYDGSSTEIATPVTTVLQETYEDPVTSAGVRKSIEPEPSSHYAISASSVMNHTDGEPIASLVDFESNPYQPNENHEPPQIPGPSPPVAATSSASRRSDGSQRSGGLHALSNNIVRSTNSVMELLFGESKPNLRRPPVGFDMNSLSGSVLPRTLLPSSVIFSEATKSWVATVNTNQKALDCNNVEEGSRSLRAFSVPNKKQAMCLAVAWSPPRMHPFHGNPNCHICDVKFAVFRRACHCRNCGVCVCNSCSVQWPSKMVPATYNIKRESVVNICKACDWLCSAFRLSLLQGDHDKAVALHATGNINLTTPFANVKGELFYPVHCAVIGSNLKLLKWLVDDHCCPLRSIRISNGKQKDLSGSYTPILTSKGRSLLGIALENRNIGIIRYLVVDKRMLLSAEKELSLETVIQNLDLVLRALPEEVLNEQTFGRSSGLIDAGVSCSGYDDVGHTSSDREHDFAAISARKGDGEDDSSTSDACIICFSNSIDCVVTPCGHQICCLECSKNINRCPVCAVECSFMRVFKP